MVGRLEGKNCLVTAAAQGIGHATVLAFAKEGAKVWATDVNMEKLLELDGVVGVTISKLDVCDSAAVVAAAKELPAMDVIFNCAG